MRLLKAQNTNLRNIYGKGVKYDVEDIVTVDSTVAMILPKGTGDENESAGTALNQRPATPINGMLRYNNDDNQIEAYQNGAWRELRFKEPNQDPGITQQNLGNGDATIVLFGPLDSGDVDYPAPAAAQNVLVFVENVFQIGTTNYTLVQNPSTTGTGQEVTAGSFVTSTEYIITSTGDTDFTTIGAADSNPGTVFTATGAGSGTGLARPTGYYLQFTSAPDLAKPVTVLHNFDK
jgi:hypothetical protein